MAKRVLLVLSTGAVAATCVVAFLLIQTRNPFYQSDQPPLIAPKDLLASTAESSFQEEQAPVLVFKKDLGKLRPGEVTKASFVIANPSLQRWTIRSIDSSCRCSQATPSAEIIEPKSQINISVAYRARDVSSDDESRVVLKLNEANSPQFVLKLVSHVRSPMSIVNREFHLGMLPTGKATTVSFNIENHTNRPWKNLQTKAPAGVEVVFQRVDTPLSDRPRDAPQETWLATVTIAASTFGLSDQLIPLMIEADQSGEKLRERVSFRFRAARPVLPVPTELHLTSRESTKLLLVFLSDDLATRFDWKRIAVEPKELAVCKLSSRRGRFVEIAVTAGGVPQSTSFKSGEASGRIVVGLEEIGLEPLYIPLTKQAKVDR